MQATMKSSGSTDRKKRAVILTALIVVVTFFWVLLFLYTNLPALALVGFGLVGALVLALATAWTAMAFPGRSRQSTLH